MMTRCSDTGSRHRRHVLLRALLKCIHLVCRRCRRGHPAVASFSFSCYTPLTGNGSGSVSSLRAFPDTSLASPAQPFAAGRRSFEPSIDFNAPGSQPPGDKASDHICEGQRERAELARPKGRGGPARVFCRARSEEYSEHIANTKQSAVKAIVRFCFRRD